MRPSGTERAGTHIIGGHQLATHFHDTGTGPLVIFCHDLHGTAVGQDRRFVTTARALAAHGVRSLRFDQYGSGNSAGEPAEASFTDWVSTTILTVARYHARGYQVAVLGHGAGATAALVTAAAHPVVCATVACAPALCPDSPDEPTAVRFAHDIARERPPGQMALMTTPGLVIQDAHDRDARVAAAVSDRHELITVTQDRGGADATARTVAFLTAAFATAA